MSGFAGVGWGSRRRWRRAAAAAVTVLVLSGLLASPASAQDTSEGASEGFGDVAADAYYAAAVGALDGDGVFEGTLCGEGFCPDAPVDRETVAVWMVRVIDGADPAAVTESRFSDVDASGLYGAFVERLADLGVTAGCGDGSRFCGKDPVTRAQMAALLSRAFDLADGPDPDFADVAAGAWYRSDVARIAASGVTAGCGDGSRFCPGSATRAQMAVFLARATGKVPTPERPAPQLPVPVGFTFHLAPQPLDADGRVLDSPSDDGWDRRWPIRRAAVGTDGALRTLDPIHSRNIRADGPSGPEFYPRFVDSGTHIAYTALQHDDTDALFVAAADGADATKLADDVYGPEVWSPDGARIAYSAPQEDRTDALFVAAADGSDAARLANNVDGWDVLWSPDSARIAYRAGGSPFGGRSLFVARTDGAAATKLADNVDSRQMWWSPDGARIAYSAAQEDGTRPLFVAAADGSGITKLADNVDHWDVWWSPDGARIAYSTRQEDGTLPLFVAAADGAGITKLADNVDHWDVWWSPDGARIAYSTRQEDGTRPLFVAAADGAGITKLADDHSWDVWWSPDGTHIAYFAGGSLFAARADGSAATKIADNVDDPQVWWSPDGARIAYTSTSTSEAFSPIDGMTFTRNTALFVVGTDGGAVSEITSGVVYGYHRLLEYEVWWSPDGELMSYVASVNECTACHSAPYSPVGFGLADRDGGNHRFLEGAVSLAWSLDSTRFASLISEDSTVRLVIEDVATGEQTTRFDVSLELPEICGRWTTWTAAGIHPNRLPRCR